MNTADARSPLRKKRDDLDPSFETVPALPSRATNLALRRFLRIALVVAGAFAAGFCARSVARLIDAPPSSAAVVVSGPITPFLALPFVHTTVLP